MRQIDADVLKEELIKALYEDLMDIDEAIDVVVTTIDDATTVDYVKHGEWIPEITELGTMVFRCSVCRRLIDIHWAYCPRCGAKMDGERKDD